MRNSSSEIGGTNDHDLPEKAVTKFRKTPSLLSKKSTENAWYFRNSLVRANYNDLKNGIHETTEYLELFLRNLLLNENHQLHNRTLHISGTFKVPEKVNIEEQKANIGTVKANIEDAFSAKTASHICTLLDKFGFQTIFGRSDVQNVLGLKPTRSSALLREMTEKEFIEPVTGFGKGKHRFKKDAGKYDENLHVITVDFPKT